MTYYFTYVLLVFCAVFFKDLLAKKLHSSLKSDGGKIIGGSNVTIEGYPYQAYLRISQIGDGDNVYHQCGGSIISAHFILSAAYCFINSTEVLAKIGSAEVSGGTVYRAAYTITHHRYDTVSKDYDIGILKTEKKMELNGVTTKALTLIERKKNIPSGTKVIVSGWGRIAPKGPLSPTLLAVELETISNVECNKILGGIHERQLCAGEKDGSKDICKGDSGGPAVLSENGIQVGIVSASYACAEPKSPSFFVNVTSLRGWIKAHIAITARRVSEDENTVKVVGGEEADIRDYPYMAYLFIYDGKQYYDCGGSIISNYHILTAAHCLENSEKVAIRIGSSSSLEGGQVYLSKAMKVHPRYSTGLMSVDFDVALIYVEQGMYLDGINTQKVELIKSARFIPENTILNVTGWGTTEEGGESMDILRATQVPTLSNKRCQEKLSIPISPHMFCAGLPQGGKDSCQGDSGGPVVSRGIQMGLVSFGYGCARPNTPGVYTHLGHPAIRKWIERVTGI